MSGGGCGGRFFKSRHPPTFTPPPLVPEAETMVLIPSSSLPDAVFQNFSRPFSKHRLKFVAPALTRMSAVYEETKFETPC